MSEVLAGITLLSVLVIFCTAFGCYHLGYNAGVRAGRTKQLWSQLEREMAENAERLTRIARRM